MGEEESPRGVKRKLAGMAPEPCKQPASPKLTARIRASVVRAPGPAVPHKDSVAVLARREKELLPDPKYLEKRCSIDLTPHERENVCRWLRSAAREFSMSHSVLLSAMNLFDRIITCRIIKREFFSLLAAVCAVIAFKMEDADKVVWTGEDWMDLLLTCPMIYTQATAIKMEWVVAERLQWRLSVVTPLHYLPAMLEGVPRAHGLRRVCRTAVTDVSVKVMACEKSLLFAPSTMCTALVLLVIEEEEASEESEESEEEEESEESEEECAVVVAAAEGASVENVAVAVAVGSPPPCTRRTSRRRRTTRGAFVAHATALLPELDLDVVMWCKSEVTAYLCRLDPEFARRRVSTDLKRSPWDVTAVAPRHAGVKRRRLEL